MCSREWSAAIPSTAFKANGKAHTPYGNTACFIDPQRSALRVLKHFIGIMGHGGTNGLLEMLLHIAITTTLSDRAMPGDIILWFLGTTSSIRGQV